jgi:predicted metal-binding membrane protein
MSHPHAASALGFWPLTVMWFGMMAAMMAPTVWPWVRSFHQLSASDNGSATAETVRFVGGYFIVWLGYSIAAAFVQTALERAGALNQPSGGSVGAAVFAVAGLYQFAPLKRACLTHCRTPLGHFLTQWRNRARDAFRMGLNHGLHCVGCCWALMATAIAVGTMSLAWMVLLAGIVLIEQVAPYGHTLRRPLGIAFLAAGVWRFSTGG